MPRNSLTIFVDMQGHEVSFDYCHKKMAKGTAWTATITDECKTIEEVLLASNAEGCLDAIVPLLLQFGNVTHIVPETENCPFAAKLFSKLAIKRI